MILTIKRKHELDLFDEDNIVLKTFLKQCNIVKRCAVNYFKKNVDATLSECEKYIKTLNNIELVNSSWIKTIVNGIKNIDDIDDNLFGSRYLFEKLSKKDYNNETERKAIKQKFINGRDTQMILMRGSKSDPNTNRCGKFELNNNILYLEFYINKNNKYYFIIDNIERNQLEDIKLLYDLIKEKKAYFNIGINKENIYFQYDNKLLTEKRHNLIEDRILSIDLNPYEIGLVIMDKENIIEERIYKIEELIKKRNSKKTDNELKFLSKMIVDMALHYKCSSLVIEKLKLKNSKIKLFNEWNVEDTRKGLNKWCDYYGIKFKEVSAYYSSFMGSFINPDKIDSLGAAIEIGKRSFLKGKSLVEDRINNFLSLNILMVDLPNRWKKEVMNTKKCKDKIIISLKELYGCLKSNSNLYYRVRVRFNEVEKYLIGDSLISSKSLIKVFDIKKNQILLINII